MKKFRESNSTPLTSEQIAAVRYGDKPIIDAAGGDEGPLVVVGPGDATVNNQTLATADGTNNPDVHLPDVPPPEKEDGPSNDAATADTNIASHPVTTPNGAPLEKLIAVRNRAMQQSR